MNSIGDSTGFTYNANVPTRQGWMKLTSTSKFCPFLGRGAVAWISICKEARNPISPGTFDKRMWKSEEAGNLIPRYSKNVSILRLLHGFVTQILRKYRTLLPFQIKEPASFRVLFSKKIEGRNNAQGTVFTLNCRLFIRDREWIDIKELELYFEP